MLIIQCDFDGTVTMSNLSTAIKEAFGPDNWANMEAEYQAGNLTAEQNTIQQFGLIDASQHTSKNSSRAMWW